MLVFLCRLTSSHVKDGTMHFFYETSELPAFYIIYFSFCVDLGAKRLLSPNSVIEAVKPVISLCHESCQFRDEDDVFLAKTTDFYVFLLGYSPPLDTHPCDTHPSVLGYSPLDYSSPTPLDIFSPLPSGILTPWTYPPLWITPPPESSWEMRKSGYKK